jgi:hypothetical protein
MMRALTLLSIWCLAHAGALSAQGVRGRLLQAGSSIPIVGALVVLEDSAGKRAAQAVSGAEGRYSVRAPTAGAYMLRVLRIGYFPYESPVLTEAGAFLDRTLNLSGVPVSLPEIAVAGTSMCGELSRGDTLSSALWTQAGIALSITAQAVRQRSYRFQTMVHNRNVDRFGNVTELDEAKDATVTSWPVRAPSPEVLLSVGFIDDIDGSPTWYGPDPEFLLSESFFRDHCFWTVPPGPTESPDWVGLAYAPGVKNQRADIEGTLWLDRRSAQLRRLNFTYTRVPRWAHKNDATGVLTFAPLPDGGWIVQRWLMHVPVPKATGRGELQMYGWRESEGHVMAVLDNRWRPVHRYDE